jgi:glycosyltransferase involved in cell wall biosynthesis
MKWLVDHHATLGFAASREAAASLFGTRWQADPRWRVLHYGIDTAPFGEERPDRAAVRAELGLPADAFVVGHVGRFAPQKNHRFLIDIAAELARREPSFRLLLVGEGGLRPAVEQRVAELELGDRVVFAGSRSDVPRLMRGAMDVLVLPSLSEGLPVVGIEAQAAGLVAVVSDVVTPELDLVPGLVRRVSLDAPASVWAEALLGVRVGQPTADPREALRAVEQSSFSIRASVESLERSYEISGTR